MHVALLGAGRLGRSLAELLPAAGVPATLWRRGEALPAADVYWLTVRDAGLAEVAAQVPRDRVALHASGALPAAVLGHPLGGVLHPLMTFPGPEVGLPALVGVGARVEGGPEALAAARWLAERLGMVAVEGVDPAHWHAAACLVSGHLAALLLDAADVLAGGVDDAPRGSDSTREHSAGLLLPLALESLRRAAERGPAAITGPAARGDEATVALHRAVVGDALPAYDALDARIRALRSRSPPR